MLLSHCLGKPNTAKPPTTDMNRALAWYANASTATAQGEPVPAPAPGLSTRDLRSGRVAARRLGWRDYEHHERWQALRRRRGMLVDFGNDVLCEFFAPELWPTVHALLRDGPVIAAARAYEALHLMAERGVAGNRRRPAGPPSLPYLKITRLAFHRIFDNVVALRHAGFEPALLEPWVHAPRIDLPELPNGGYEVQAPPPHLVRAKLDELTCDVRARLGIAPASTFDEEAAAITALSPRAGIGLWRPLQRRMLLGLYTVLGGRKEAMMLLRRMDFIPDHRFPEGGSGPVLKLRPRKHAGRWLVRTKRLHPELAAMIANHLLFIDRKVRLAYSDPTAIRRDGRPAPPAAKMPSDAALVPISVSDWRALDPRAVFTGHTYRDAHSGEWVGQTYALIPRLGELPEDLPEAMRPFVGYTPHEYRHLAYQLAVRAGVLYNERNVGSGAEAWARPDLYGHATLDHGNHNDLGNLYGDFGTEAAIETLTARAIRGSWELLATEAGARRRPDVETYVRELEALHRIEGELDDCALRATKLTEIEGVHRDLESQPPAVHRNVHAKLDQLIRQNGELLRQVKALREATLEGHALTHEILRLTERRALLIKRVGCLRHDTRTWLRIPDTDPTPAPVDWDEIDERVYTRRLLAAALREPSRASEPALLELESSRARGGAIKPPPPRPKWSDERIRAELSPLLAGRDKWPGWGEFRAAGKYALYRAVRRHGGREHWAREFGFATPRETASAER